MIEFELKFQVPRSQRLEVASALGLFSVRRQRLQAAYFDTEDGRLASHRLSLRLRKEGRDWVQTLKAPGESAVHRLEHNVRRPGSFGSMGPELDVALHAGTPAGDALLALLTQGGARASPELRVTYRADVWRKTTWTSCAGTVVEVALDEGELVAADRRAEVSELEFELVEGSPASLVALAASLALPHGLWLSTISKAERGELLARGLAAAEPTHASLPRLADAQGSPVSLLRAALAACLEQVLANASVVADGHAGAEHIHQLRVGLRRLRTALRELGGLAPAAVQPGWDVPLAHAFSELGEVRDRDTVAAAVASRLAEAGGPPLAPPPQGAEMDLAATVRAPGFQLVLLQILALSSPEGTPAAESLPATAPAQGGAAADVPKPRRHVRKRLSRLHQQITRDTRRFETLDEESQHRVRKRLKRLRYLSELVAGLFEKKAVDKFLSALRPAQESLGDYNDLLVAREMYRRAAAAGQASAWFAVGWLVGQAPASARACRKALQKVAEAPVFW